MVCLSQLLVLMTKSTKTDKQSNNTIIKIINENLIGLQLPERLTEFLTHSKKNSQLKLRVGCIIYELGQLKVSCHGLSGYQSTLGSHCNLTTDGKIFVSFLFSHLKNLEGTEEDELLVKEALLSSRVCEVSCRTGSFLPKNFWATSTLLHHPSILIRTRPPGCLAKSKFKTTQSIPSIPSSSSSSSLRSRTEKGEEEKMSHNTTESSHQQPHHYPPIVEDNINPFYTEGDLPHHPNPTETNPFLNQQQHDEPRLYPKPDEKNNPVPELAVSPPPPPPPVTASSSSSLSAADAAAAVSSSSSAPVEEEKWGTCVMGTPAVPTVHPDNKKAALWGATGEEAHHYHHPYVQYSPIERPASRNAGSGSGSGGSGGGSSSPMENILHMFNSWSNKAETMASNIWQNLKTGPSVSAAAWGKVNLRAKAITGGGFETLYKQTFSTFPNETLKKTFACYLSTSTGPVAGTLYLSNIHAAFCSDRPLSFTAPSGQVTWSYYKVFVPLGKIGAVNPVVMRENQLEKYIQIVTLEGHDFWFMGFVNYEKACRHLTESVSAFVASGVAVYQQPPNAASHP